MVDKPSPVAYQKRIVDTVRSEIRAINAYHVPPAAGLVKLDAMENPFEWPGDLEQQWLASLGSPELNRYPDPQAVELKERIRSCMSISDEFDILLGNGSDEIIQIIAQAAANPGRCVMAPDPSFVMYDMIARFVGMNFVPVPLTEEQFDIDLPAFLEAVEAYNPAVVFIAQPNNPTGNGFGEEKLRRIIEATRGLVVIDEAYLPFAESDSMKLLPDYPNLVIMRTLSKVGLAGLRLGILVGVPDWLTEFDKIRLPYNINTLTQKSAIFALDHYDVLLAQTSEIRLQRQLLFEQLADIDQVHAYRSQANFILIRLSGVDAVDVHQRMKEQGVLVKCLAKGHPMLANCLRLTVGTALQNGQMLAALTEALKGS